MKIPNPQKWTGINKVQILDESSEKDGNSKSTKVDGYKIKSIDWTNHPKRMKIQNPQKWTDINKVYRLDESSQEDENSKSTKVDGYIQSP